MISWCLSINSSEENGEKVSTLTKIVLTTDKTSINSNGTDTVTFSAKGYDASNNEITLSGAALYKDGVVQSGMTFKTTVSGTYSFVIKSGNVTSNSITILVSAKDIYYTIAQKMLGNWIITNPSLSKEYYKFSEIKQNEETGKYYAIGTMIARVTGNGVQNNTSILVIATYTEKGTIAILSSWSATGTTSVFTSFYEFNFTDENNIEGIMTLSVREIKAFEQNFTGVRN